MHLRRRRNWIAGLTGLLGTALAGAQEPEATGVRLEDYLVRGESTRDEAVQPPFLPAVSGLRLLEGKKTSVIDFDAMPQIQTDNYRQAFTKTPGLLTSELSNASLLSLGYRGIGDPHETQNLLVLKDGVPFVLDPFGYPTVYFAPPFEGIDRLEFIRGGAALLYGPQPSGALNFVTHTPRSDGPLFVSTQHILGSDDLYSTYTAVEGTVGRVGYGVSFDYRSGDSFRSRNSDFELAGVNFHAVVAGERADRWVFDLDAYRADSGEPGGLAATPGPGRVAYSTDRDFAPLAFDRVRVTRWFGSALYERDFGRTSQVAARVWGGWVRRWSRRENGQGFGTLPTGRLTVGSGPTALAFTQSNTLTEHQYRTLAGEVRLRHDWGGADQPHTLTAGLTLLAVDSPITNRVGATPAADDGRLITDADRSSRYAAVFAEQAWRWGGWTVTPGLRLELLEQEIEESLNLNKTLRPTPTPLGAEEDTDLEPLFGLGVTRDFARSGVQAYLNVSQAWKPKTYTDAVPLGGTDTVSRNLEAARAVNYEVGVRGRHGPLGWWETSLFAVDYEDRFGRVGSAIGNVGRSVNLGWDVAGELDLWPWLAGPAPAGAEAPSLALHANAQFLDARFVGGPLDGRTPQYAPKTMARAGLVYRDDGRLKVALLFTHLSRHFADDANTVTATQDWTIPAYTVADLTFEARVWQGDLQGRPASLHVLAGVNNLFDESYWSRVRSNGIDPANGRNYYAGLRLSL